jgi:hypothetical protein
VQDPGQARLDVGSAQVPVLHARQPNPV